MRLPFLVVLLLTSACGKHASIPETFELPRTFGPEGAEAYPAVEAPRSSIADLLVKIEDGGPGAPHLGARITVRFNGMSQLLWVRSLRRSGHVLVGEPVGDPWVPGVGSEVWFGASDISDWFAIEDGVLIGGWTWRAARDRMTPQERAAMVAAVPFRFEGTSTTRAGSSTVGHRATSSPPPCSRHPRRCSGARSR